MDGTVLVADDDRTIRTVLTQALTRAGCTVHATSSLTTLMRWVAEGRGDAVITDVAMPDGNGLEMLPKIAMDRPDLPVIVISAQNTIMTAIKASEAKAFDYLPKPFDLPDLMKRVGRALSQSTPRVEVNAPQPMQDDLPLIGKTAVMQTLFRTVAQVINAEMPVLIWGETGVGKSLIARVIHDFSDRRGAPFVVATAEDLAGQDGPARVLARASGGTILLEDVADIGDDAQFRLIRLLDAEADAKPRVLATMQGDPNSPAAQENLRPDLLYRLSGVVMPVPALRDRVEDIGILAQHFLQEHQPNRTLSEDAQKVLSAHSWPGNVRQLQHVIRQLALPGQAPEIGADEVLRLVGHQSGESPDRAVDDGERLGASIERHLQRYFDLHGESLPPAGLYQRILREMEIPLLNLSLAACYGNQAKCADLLGINRNTLRKKLTELNIEVTRGRKMM